MLPLYTRKRRAELLQSKAALQPDKARHIDVDKVFRMGKLPSHAYSATAASMRDTSSLTWLVGCTWFRSSALISRSRGYAWGRLREF